jgi:hypothetical protein
MKHRTITLQPLILVFFCILINLTHAQGFQWVSTGGGQSLEIGTDVAIDASGNIYQCGYFASDTAYFGSTSLINPVQAGSFNSSEQAYLVKTDPTGTPLWSVQAGGNDFDNANSIALDGNGNVYMTGYFSGTADFSGTQLVGTGGKNFFIAKYNTDGTLQWANSGSGTGSYESKGIAITADANGNVYVSGYFTDAFTITSSNNGDSTYTYLGSNSRNAFVARYSPDGDLVWFRRFADAGSHHDGIPALQVSDDGTWISMLGGHGGLLSIENMMYDTSMAHPSSLAISLFVAGMDSDGIPLWISGIENDVTSPSIPAALDMDSNGNTYITGELKRKLNFGGGTILAIDTTSPNTYYDAYVAKYDAQGSLLWAKSYWDQENMEGQALAVGPDDLPYLAGTYEGQPTLGSTTLPYGNPSLFLAKLDANGTPTWAYGESQALTGTESIAIPAANQVILSGDFNVWVEFGNLDPQSRGLTDSYILKYSNGGVGIEEELGAAFEVSMFPNPAQDNVRIELTPLDGNQNIHSTQVMLTDLSGRMLRHTKINQTTAQFDLKDLPMGMYLLSLEGDWGQATSRLVISR